MNVLKILSLIIFPTIVLLACQKEENNPPKVEYEKLKKTIQYKELSNVAPNLLSLDIYYTSNTDQKKPIVIYVHGGGWSIGDKAKQMANKPRLFESLGYVFVSINYRLSPYPYKVNNTGRIKFPQHNNDVADAIKWVYENIQNYGGDNNKIALLGHSAGAHLVALTGTNPQFLESVGLSLSNLKGVAAIDTEGYDVPVKVAERNLMYINAFGTDSEMNKAASPLYNIKSNLNYPKFFIAKRGKAKRLASANKFINKMQTNGISVAQVEGNIYDHAGINNAIGDKNETLITEPLKAFLADCFK